MKVNRISKTILMILLIILLLSITTNTYAANNMAFSAGKGYDGIDVSQATISCYSSYASMGYNSYYSTSGANRSILAGSFSNGTKRLESDIVFLTGHGSWDRLSTTATGGVKIGNGTNSKFVGTNNVNWKNVKLAIFLACNTGEETSNSEINLAYNVFKKSNWTTTTMGWHQAINHDAAIAWIDNFNSKLETGATVSRALNYANSKSYVNNTIKDIAFYGNQNLVLKKSRSMTNNAIDESNIIPIEEKVYFDGQNIKPITNLLSSIFEEFNIEDYEVDIFTISKDDDYYTIDFTYKIDDAYTNSSYTVIVNKGEVVQVADNSIELNHDNIDYKFDNYENQEMIAKEIGTSMTYKQNNINCISNFENIAPITIRKQRTRKYIDLEENKKYIQVETEYSYKGSEEIGANCYEYEI